MKELEAVKFSDEHIEFSRREDIARLMELLNSAENFIIYHFEDGQVHAMFVLASDLLGRVRTGDTVITAVEVPE